MQLLVAVGDGAVGIDPDQRVGDAGRGRGGGFVDADVDGEGVCAGGRLEAEDEGGAGRGQAERDGFAGGRGDVVGRFGQEERLEKKALCEEAVNGGLEMVAEQRFRPCWGTSYGDDRDGIDLRQDAWENKEVPLPLPRPLYAQGPGIVLGCGTWML
jgi:hypothetical protein